MIPVEGHKGLYRDGKSNAIVNCNDYEYQNDFFVKSLIISSDSSFYDENVVRLNFE